MPKKILIPKRSILLPFAIALFLITVTAGIWDYLDRQIYEKLRLQGQNEAKFHVSLIEADIRSRLPALQRVVDRWVMRGGTPKAEFIVDVSSYVNDMPGFQAIEWVDSDYYVRWIIPMEGNEKALNLNLAYEEKRIKALKNAQEKSMPTVTSVIDLVQGGKGFLIYFPINYQERFDGFLIAVMKIEPWLNYAFNLDGPDKEFKSFVDFDGVNRYEQQGMGSGIGGEWTFTSTTNILGRELLVTVLPTQVFFDNHGSNAPEWAVLLGLLTTILITYIVILYQKTVLTSNSLMSSNASLENEICERQQSEERFSSIAENVGDAIYIHDRYGIISYTNKISSDQLGYTRGEFLSMSLAQLDASKNFDELRDTWDLDEADPSNYPMTLEAAHRRKDGTVFPIEVRVSLLPSGDKTLFIAMVRDITKRQEADKMLFEKVRELDFQKSALDQYAIVSVTNLDGNITYVNNRFCHVSGFSREELLGKDHRILCSGEHSRSFFEQLWSTLSKGEVWRGIIKNRAKIGTYYWVDATIVPVLDDGGKPLKYVSIRTDISAQKNLETDLIKAKEEAEGANKAKSDFLSSMSHELRTPMNAVLGFGQMLGFNADEPLTTLQAECVRQIMMGGEHLLVLINDILDLAKIESGQVDLSMENVSVNDLLHESMPLLLSLAEKSKVTVNIPELDIQKPLVNSDRTRLKQLLLNLISNAIKYNKEGGSVSVSCKLTDDQMLHIRIADTGYGIPKEKQKELFLPFSRLGAENSSIEGSGIGLVVCKEITQLLGGRIGFESEVGEGSTFWIELPIAEENIDNDTNNDAIEKLGNIHMDVSGTVLYVEDKPSNINLMEMIISQIKGIHLVVAHTGELGLELARVEKPDVIILDINLPGISGYDILKELQSDEKLRRTPVFALSANATDSSIKNGLEAGFMHYLTKPVQIPLLVEILNSLLGGDK